MNVSRASHNRCPARENSRTGTRLSPSPSLTYASSCATSAGSRIVKMLPCPRLEATDS